MTGAEDSFITPPPACSPSDFGRRAKEFVRPACARAPASHSCAAGRPNPSYLKRGFWKAGINPATYLKRGSAGIAANRKGGDLESPPSKSPLPLPQGED
jgi:hypothetical protein